MPRSRASSVKETVKAPIAKQIHHLILTCQVENDLDYAEASRRIATLAKTNSEEFKRQVDREAQARINSLLMRQLNKAKESVRQRVRTREDNFRVPCHKCGKLMLFSSRDDDWAKESEVLNNAFSEWAHVTCP